MLVKKKKKKQLMSDEDWIFQGISSGMWATEGVSQAKDT